MMARNKHPEQTVKQILSAASQLFLKKGYEQTSIQDIINELGGLSKGAIYHHFKSKEEIVIAVVERLENGLLECCETISHQAGLTGLEKLREIMLQTLKAPRQRQLAETVPTILHNPKFLAMQLESGQNELVPKVIAPLIQEGIADGSIQTDYPLELAQVLIMLLNIWLNPFVFAMTEEELRRKCHFFQLLTARLGFDILDDEMVEIIVDLQGYLPKEARK